MADLQARPARRIARPVYPTLLEVRADPAVLRRMPSAWRRRGEIVSLAGVYLAAQVGGCADDASTAVAGGARSARAAIVAPVFGDDGPLEGWSGFYGCDGDFRCTLRGSPGVFHPSIDVSQAIQIIREEMQLAGLAMDAANVQLDPVSIRHRETGPRAYEWLTDRTLNETRVVQEPLVVDLYDAEHRVAIEYLSDAEASSFDCAGDVQTGAHAVSEAVRGNGIDVYFGAFHDPGLRPLRFDERGREEQRADAQDRLRMQVRQFLEWLVAQGVI